ncbi:hypothetical protein DFH08DRAFT_993266 [Mycena albidolilacea]|uniref:Uncharacterized protein n=1 Tax=Mycena albidolilacea TaxID=1033008 RepID=A0AAD7EWB2_9AGAR|nr:hypothetical protein DFH08DRAFT_993266 [Mycena albidolilacea]
MTKRAAALSARKKGSTLASSPHLSSEPGLPLFADADFEQSDQVTQSGADDDVLLPGSPSSPEITPPPKKRPAQVVEAADSDSDEEVAVQPKKKKSKAGPKKTVKEVDPAEHPKTSLLELVLMIPRAECEGSQREVLTHATTFDDALDIIYRTVGCTDIGKKPVLVYKLSTATTKVTPISLASQADWDGCLDEVTAAEGKKKVNVNILVTEQSGVPAKSKGSKNRIRILDLEHTQSGEDDFDDGLGIMEKERNWIQQLQAKYTKCQLCGPTKSCKIDISSNHHNLSNNQLRAWAHSLVCFVFLLPPGRGYGACGIKFPSKGATAFGCTLIWVKLNGVLPILGETESGNDHDGFASFSLSFEYFA